MVSLCSEQVGDADQGVAHHMQPKPLSHLDRAGALSFRSPADRLIQPITYSSCLLVLIDWAKP
jgi:hypothetical protein